VPLRRGAHLTHRAGRGSQARRGPRRQRGVAAEDAAAHVHLQHVRVPAGMALGLPESNVCLTDKPVLP
jgi:hypothetical protein